MEIKLGSHNLCGGTRWWHLVVARLVARQEALATARGGDVLPLLGLLPGSLEVRPGPVMVIVGDGSVALRSLVGEDGDDGLPDSDSSDEQG